MALLLALGAMGTAYGAWVDEIYIEGTLSTGDISTSLDCGTCWEEPETEDTDIDCTADSPMTLNIEVTNAMEDVDYYCNFTVSNATGSLPIKIESMSITDSYSGVTEVIEDLTVGTVIDPGNTATGKVHIYLTSGDSVGEDISVALAVSVERWNE
jgi:hypothetical protein